MQTPTSVTGPEAGSALPRRVGPLAAIAVMIGIIIGSGIFRTPPEIATQLDSGWLVLLMWVVGGVMALFGALTYAELGAMYPQSGGIYVFLREAYGRWLAFVFGWTYLLISKPMAAGGIAVIFADHFNRLFHTQFDNVTLTCITLTVLTLVNVIGVELGARVAVVLTALKVLALLVIVGLGLVMAPSHGSASNFVTGAGGLTVEAKPLWQALVAVMAAVLWTYDGWSDVGAIAGEVKNPGRTLPLIYLAGTSVIIGIYVSVNAAYLWHISLAEMRTADTIAPMYIEGIAGGAGAANADGSAASVGAWGGWGATIVALVVVISTLGSTHGSIMTGARVTFQQARDGLFFSALGRVNPTFKTPAVSLWTQLALSCLGVCWFQTFEKLASGFVFTMWIFYALAGAGIFILRAKRPKVERPYRCFGYPFVPVVFVLSGVLMTVLLIAENPKDTLLWAGILAAGIPVYFIWSRLMPGRATARKA